MVKEKIKKELSSAIKKVTGKKPDKVQLERPQNPAHGDYSTNWALSFFSKKYGKNPYHLARKIVEQLPQRSYLANVEAVKPGFLNFTLSHTFFLKSLERIVKDKRFGTKNLGKKEKVIIEFGQPNTHKPPHIGHFRSYNLGESLARLLEFTNHKVFRANYQGDIGLFVAKCLWGWKEKSFKESKDLKENTNNLQKAYVYGSKMWEKEEGARRNIREINKRIYEGEKEAKKLWKKTRGWSLSYYQKLNKRLGIDYNREYFESEAAKRGKKIVRSNLGTVFEKSKGAIVFPGEKHGLHTRVFITSEGLPTYEAKDLALPFLKKEDFDYDRSLISTGLEQKEYFKVVYAAVGEIEPELAANFTHIPFGLVSLEGKKLSSRKGNIVSIDELLGVVETSLWDLMAKKDYSKKRIEEIIEVLTIGASKYSILKHAPSKNIVFKMKETIALEGNSGPYLQYTHARARSIIRKSKPDVSSSLKKPLSEKELPLLKTLLSFPEAVEKATLGFSPNLVSNYLFELAQEFNTFYEKVPVLKSKGEDKKRRLALVKATAKVLKKGLYLLGIEAPDRM